MSPWLRFLVELASPSTFSHFTGAMARGTAGFAKCLTGLLTLQTALGNPIKSEKPCPPTELKDGQLGAVASESEICSHIGIDLLKLGGNAADALVGTVACVGVVGMYHSGKFDSKNPQTLSPVLVPESNRC